MNEINETLSVQANLVKMIQELTNVSSYKASSLAGENEIFLNSYRNIIYISSVSKKLCTYRQAFTNHVGVKSL